MTRPAVVLACHTTGLSVIRGLGIAGVPILALSYDPMDMGNASRYLKEKGSVSHPERSEAAFLEELLWYAERWGGSVLFPTDDATLAVVSKNKDMLKKRYLVACPEWEITEKFIDKRLTYSLAEGLGIPVPKTLVPRHREEVEEFARSVDYPCLVKPAHSHRYFEAFRKKLEMVADSGELLAAYDEASRVDAEVMIQEYIPGGDSSGVNYNSYVLDGHSLVEFTAEKVRLSPPRFGVPRVVVSKKIGPLAEHSQRLLRAMGFYGFACTEYKKDARDGVYKLMEVNGRHNRSALLAIHCGINFPLIEYDHLVKGDLPRPRDYPEGVYWIDEFRDIGHSLAYFRKEKYGLFNYLRPYLANHVFAVFSWMDPKPFLKRVSDLPRSVFHKSAPAFKGGLAPTKEGGTIRAK